MNSKVDSIARDIIGVQPMYSPFTKEVYPYQVDFLMTGKYEDIFAASIWCSDNLPDDEWANRVQFFAFKTEEAYLWFKLRWM